MGQTDPMAVSRCDAYPFTLELRLTALERDTLEQAARERGVFPDTVLYLHINDMVRGRMRHDAALIDTAVRGCKGAKR